MTAVVCMQGVSVSVSVLTLTAISLERYYAIVHPLQLRATLGRTRFTILAIWVVSAVLMVPDLVVILRTELPAICWRDISDYLGCVHQQ